MSCDVARLAVWLMSNEPRANRAGKQNLTFSKPVEPTKTTKERSVMEDKEEKEKKP